MKYCPKCKAMYEDWAEQCSDCNVSLVGELPKEHAEQNEEKEREIRLCSQCGYPVEVDEKACKNCGLQTGPYDTLDPLKQIYEQGRVYRKMASGNYDKREVSPYMSIFASSYLFLIPAIILFLLSIVTIKSSPGVSVITFLFAVPLGLLGSKALLTALRKIRNTPK